MASSSLKYQHCFWEDENHQEGDVEGAGKYRQIKASTYLYLYPSWTGISNDLITMHHQIFTLEYVKTR